MNRVRPLRRKGCKSVPRRRGDEPLIWMQGVGPIERSPQARG